jgi:hypothetical protein
MAGGRTCIEIKDVGGTDIKWNNFNDCEKTLKIELGGDTELDTITEVFDFVAKTLKNIIKESEIAGD